MILRHTYLLFFLIASLFVKAQQVQLLYNWKDTTLPPTSAFNNTYNEVWGFEQNGREYGVIGSTMGAHFFDVTDKNNIQFIDFVPGKDQGPHIIHRDFHDYNGYLYMVSDEGASSLQIVDLSYLPDSVSLVYDSDQLFVRSHNIFIDSLNAKLYVCSGSLKVYSLSNPLSPSLFTTINLPSSVHDVYVRNDTAYVNDGNDGLYIYDVSVPNPNPLNTLSFYPQKGYNHSGWLSDDGSMYIFADEDHGKQMKVIDVSDLNDLTVRSTFMTMTNQYSIAHNQIIKENYVYVSQYFDGFRMYDFSDPDNVVEVGNYPTSSQPVQNNMYEGAWGVYPLLKDGKVLVSDMQNGFFVLDVSSLLTSNIELEKKNSFKIYPNPSLGEINIEFNEADKKHLIITDCLGQKIYESNGYSNQLKINLADQPKGIYFVRVSNTSHSYTQKVIIQ